MTNVRINELEIVHIDDTDRIEVTAKLKSHKRRELALEYLIGDHSKQDGLTRAGWTTKMQSVQSEPCILVVGWPILQIEN